MDKRLWGSVMGACIGDAMGAPTEMRTRDQILEFFGDYVKTFIAPPEDVFAKGRLPGQVTDDFSIAYYLLKEIVKEDGIISEEIGKNAIINWSNNEEYCPKFAGPTTMAAINKLKIGEVFDPALEFGLVNYNNLGTNGASMKIFPIGLLNGRKFDKTISDVITVCRYTHFTNLALAGACAIACAVGEAKQLDSTKDSIISAGLYGARVGDLEAKRILNKICAGPSIEKRIELAVTVGKTAKSFDELLVSINDSVGTGIWVWESIPAVFGIVSYVDNTMDGIYAGVNIGNDTDTIATMVGAILGAFFGNDDLDQVCLEEAVKVNDMELKNLTQKLEEICLKNM